MSVQGAGSIRTPFHLILRPTMSRTSKCICTCILILQIPNIQPVYCLVVPLLEPSLSHSIPRPPSLSLWQSRPSSHKPTHPFFSQRRTRAVGAELTGNWSEIEPPNTGSHPRTFHSVPTSRILHPRLHLWQDPAVKRVRVWLHVHVCECV